MLWVGDWNSMAEGIWEKFWAHRRSKSPLLRGQEEEGWITTGIFLFMVHKISEGGVALVQATSGEKPLAWAMGDWMFLVQAVGGRVLLAWAGSNGRLSVMWCLLCDLQAEGTDCSSLLGGWREALPATGAL